MKKSIVFILVLCLTAGMSSCINADNLHFKGVKSVEVKSFTLDKVTADVGMEIVNTSRNNLKVLGMNITYTVNSKPMVTMQLLDRVTIRGREDQVAVFPLQLNLNPLTAARIMRDPQAMEQGTIEGEIIVRAGLARRKITIPPTPVKDFIEQNDLDLNNLTL